MDDFDYPAYPNAPTTARPLLGLTILVVEDSRFASEAMRLLCVRSGARIRRADCLTSARRHLQVYRPSAILIDLGLPDGSGLDLISELHNNTPRIGVILGMSGDDGTEPQALAAGANGFLTKPVKSHAHFQLAILSHLPADRQPSGPRAISEDPILPDSTTYRDDLEHAAELLHTRPDGHSLAYLAQFLGSIARSADDPPLAQAARRLAQTNAATRPSSAALSQLAGLVQRRLSNRLAI